MRAPPVSPPLRDALVAAMLPSPGGGLPGASELDLSSFWPRFEAAAPIHLRLAFRAATVIIAGVLPITLGYRRSLATLDDDTRDVRKRTWRIQLLLDQPAVQG